MGDALCKLHLSAAAARRIRARLSPHTFPTLQEGYIQRQPPSRTTLGEIRQYFLRYAPAIGSSYNSKHVAILRLADGTPKLLGRQEFEEVCDRLEGQLASGECDEDTPCVLQVGNSAHST